MGREKENKLKPNATQIPNVILDFLVPRLPESEGKCINYICRRTYGFQKEEDRISLTQFVEGIKSRNGKKKLDYGAGMSRPSVVEALKNLIAVGFLSVRKTTKGNFYRINFDFAVDKDVENELGKVVKKVNQLRKLTRNGKKTKPKQVKLFNLQNKGNKGNKDVVVKNLNNGERRLMPVGDPPKINKKGLKKYQGMKNGLIKKFNDW